jgi:hypothetical protein
MPDFCAAVRPLHSDLESRCRYTAQTSRGRTDRFRVAQEDSPTQTLDDRGLCNRVPARAAGAVLSGCPSGRGFAPYFPLRPHLAGDVLALRSPFAAIRLDKGLRTSKLSSMPGTQARGPGLHQGLPQRTGQMPGKFAPNRMPYWRLTARLRRAARGRGLRAPPLPSRASRSRGR